MEFDPNRLMSLSPLSKLSTQSINRIICNATLLQLSQGDLLFAMGDTSPYSFYLLDGDLELQAKDRVLSKVNSNSSAARFAVGNLIPRQMDAHVTSRSALVIRFDRDLIERELILSGFYGSSELDSPAYRHSNPDDIRWFINLIHTPLMARLPTKSIPAFLQAMEKIPVQAGQEIMHQGDPGDYFYILREGRARVVRNTEDKEIILNHMGEMDAFGDEALLADQPRGASVIMEQDGYLMRLDKSDFLQLMNDVISASLDLTEAASLVKNNEARLIDIRSEEDFNKAHLPHAQNIPMYLLYLKSRGFSRSHKYIVYACHETLAQAAVLLLTKGGCDACMLEYSGWARNCCKEYISA